MKEYRSSDLVEWCVNNEVTFGVLDDGRLVPSCGIENIPPAILDGLKRYRDIIVDYARGIFFPSALNLWALISEAPRADSWVKARFAPWMIAQAVEMSGDMIIPDWMKPGEEWRL